MRTNRHYAGRTSGLILTALLAVALPGCRKASAPPGAAESSPAPASAPAAASEPGPALLPASAPAPAPGPASLPASAPAPTVAPIALPAGGLAQVRTDAQSRREEARKGQGYREAFELWERAEGKLAAAVEAARKGQADDEARGLIDAAGNYERVVKIAAALTRARAELAAQRTVEALAAVGEALAIDPACPTGLALREDVRLLQGQRDLLAEKTKAQAAVAGAVSLSNAHGFAAMQGQARRELRKADAHYARGRFAEAAVGYKALVVLCERMKAVDVARQASETLRGQVEVARARACAVDGMGAAGALWAQALQADEAAAKAQAGGDFESAKTQWASALSSYDQAAGTGAAVQAVRAQLAGRQFPAATAAAEALTRSAPGNEGLRSLLAEIAAAKARDEALVLEAASQQALIATVGLDGAGPFGDWKAAAWARHMVGEKLLCEDQCVQAGKEFQAVVAECGRLKTLDLARQSLAGTRAALAGQRLAGWTAGAHRLAPSRWERAQVEFAAGEAAFMKGDYETAKTTWASAAREYQAAAGAAGAIATARSQLAQGAFAEAARTVQSAQTADVTSERAKALAGAIDLASQRAAAGPARTAATADVKAASDLDAGEGFGVIRVELWKSLSAAETLFEDGRFADASAAYKALSARCQQVKSLDAARQAAATVRAQALAKRQELLASRMGGAAWTAGEKAYLLGVAEFANGRFEPAGKQWAQALERYAQAAVDAAGAAKVQAGLAEWLAARGRTGGEGQAIVQELAGGRWPGVAQPLALAQDAARSPDERAGAYRQAAAQWATLKNEALTALTTRVQEAMKGKKFAEAVAAGTRAMLIEPGSEAVRNALGGIEPTAVEAAVAPAKARAEGAAASIAGLADGQGVGAGKNSVVAHMAAGNAAMAQKQAGQALASFVEGLVKCEQVKAMDVRRGEAAKRQAEGKGRQQEAKKQGADTEATVSWQRGEAAMAAAEQAFAAGEFDLADVRLGEARAAYDAAAGASGAIGRARAKLAGKDFAGAASEAFAAEQADVGNEMARKLTGEIRLACAMAAATPAKNRGQAVGTEIAALADAQGFAARKAQVQQALAAAAEAWGRTAYEEAAWRYETAVAGAGKVKERDGKRQEIAKRQAAAKSKREEGVKRQGDKVAPTVWQLAEGAMTASTQAYEGGDFEEAQTLLDDAVGWWTRAGELGESVSKAQGLVAAGKAPDAVAILRTVLTGDPASAPATAAMQAIDLAARRGAVAGWQKSAEAALASVTALADTEGFAAGKQSARQMQTTGAEHFAGGRFEQAAFSWATTILACEQLKASDARRKDVAAAKTQADALAPKVQALPDVPGLQVAKAYAGQEYQAATGLYAAGRFDEAARRFVWAAAMMDKLLAQDVQRQEAQKVRIALDGRFARAQSAGLPQQAGEYMQLAEQARAAGEGAGQRGDYTTARQEWEFSQGWLDEGEGLLSATGRAVAAMGGGKLDEAWQVIQAARDIGFDNPGVAQQETLVRQALRRRAGEGLRRRAEAAMAEALKAAPGQGVDAFRQQAQQHAAEARQNLDGNSFDAGERLCRDVIVECDAIAAIETRRAISLPARTAATAAVAKIAPLTDANGFGAIKNQIRQTFAAGEAFFEQRQFDQADGPYERTLAECKRLGELETARQELEAWRLKLPAEQQKAAAAEVAKWAPDKWKKMEEAYRSGQAAFDAGDLAKARAEWGPLVEGYGAAAANVDVLRAVYDGQSLWDQARASVPKEYFDQMDRYGGGEWEAVKTLVAAGENEKLPQAERIAAFKKASVQVTVVAGKVEDLHRRAMCAQLTGEARALLGGVPRRATERTGEHFAQAQKALDLAGRALTYRATDQAATDVALEAKALATPLTTGACLRTMPAQKAWLLALAMDPAGDKAVTGGEDSSLRLWDVWRGTEGATWEGHPGGTYAVAFAADGRTVLSGGEDGTVRLSTPGGGTQGVKFVGHTGPVTGVAFAPDAQRVLSASEDGTLRLWDAATGASVRTFTGHTGGVNAVAFSPDGKRALSAGADRSVRLWDLATGQCLLVLSGHAGAATSVAWAGEARAVSASADKTIKLWDLVAGRVIHTLAGHTASVDCVAVSPDGKLALSGGRDETVRLWDLAGGRGLGAFEGHRGWVRGVAFGPNGTTAASLDETAMKVWYVGKGEPPKK